MVNLVVNLSILIVSTVERLDVLLHINTILQFDDVLCGSSFRMAHGKTLGMTLEDSVENFLLIAGSTKIVDLHHSDTSGGLSAPI